MTEAIRAGDIGFVHDRESWVGRAIAWFMGSRFSHCLLVLECAQERVYTLETFELRVQVGVLRHYLSKPERFRVEIWRLNGETPGDAAAGANEVFKWRYAEDYGHGQLLSLGVRRLLMRVGIKIGNFIRAGVVCVGVVADAKARGRIPPFAGMDPEALDTEEFYQLVQANGTKLLESGA